MHPSPSHPTPSSKFFASLRRWVGVHLPLAAGHSDVYKAAGVGDALLRSALRRLLFLLWLDLWKCVESLVFLFHTPLCMNNGDWLCVEFVAFCFHDLYYTRLCWSLACWENCRSGVVPLVSEIELYRHEPAIRGLYPYLRIILATKVMDM